MKNKIITYMFGFLVIMLSECSTKTELKQRPLIWDNVDTDALLFADYVAKSYNLPTIYKITNKTQNNDTCTIYLTPANCFDCRESSLKIRVDLKNKKIIDSGFVKNY